DADGRDGSGEATSDAESDGRHEGRPEPARLEWRHDVAECGAAVADADRDTIRQQPVGIVGRGGEAEPGRSRTEAAPDAEHGGRGRRTREPVRSEIGRTTPA